MSPPSWEQRKICPTPLRKLTFNLQYQYQSKKKNKNLSPSHKMEAVGTLFWYLWYTSVLKSMTEPVLFYCLILPHYTLSLHRALFALQNDLVRMYFAFSGLNVWGKQVHENSEKSVFPGLVTRKICWEILWKIYHSIDLGEIYKPIG